MPIFEYQCSKCRHVTAFLERAEVRHPHRCEKCGSQETKKTISVFAAQSGRSSSSGSTCPTGTCPLS